MELICPVCGRSNDPTLVQSCGQCATDLRPLIRLRALPLESYRRGMQALNEGNWEAAHSNLAVAATLEPGSLETLAALEKVRNAQSAAWNAAAGAPAPPPRPVWWNWTLPFIGLVLGAGLVLAYQAVRHDADSKGAVNLPVAQPAALQATPRTTTAVLPRTVSYTVRTGDSLWLIARRKYGNGAFWPTIRDANPGRHDLHPGDTLLLPEVTIKPGGFIK